MQILYRDGTNDDAPALEAMMAGVTVARPSGRKVSPRWVDGDLRVAGTFQLATPAVVPSGEHLDLELVCFGIGGSKPQLHYA